MNKASALFVELLKFVCRIDVSVVWNGHFVFIVWQD